MAFSLEVAVMARAITSYVEAYGSAYVGQKDRFHRPNTKETKKMKKKKKVKLAKGDDLSSRGCATS